MLGVAMLVGPVASRDVPGEAACLLAAMSYSLAGIYGRRFKGLPSLQVATGQVTCAAVAMLPVAGIADRFWTLPWPSPTAWGALAGIALLCTVLAYILYFRILAAAGATNLLLVTLLLPVSALLLGNVVLGEAIQPAALAGMGLIGLGLAAIDGRLLMLFRSRALKSQLPPGLE